MQIVQTAILMATAFLSGSGLPVVAQEPIPAETSSPGDEVERLRKIWADWKQKATSIEVEGFEFYGVVGADDGPSRESLVKLVQEDLPKLLKETPKSDLAALNAVTTKLFPHITNDNRNSATFGRWAEVSLIRATDNVKWIMHGSTTRTMIRRGPIEQTYGTDTRQASVYMQSGGERVPEIDTFLYGPAVASKSQPWRLLETHPSKRELLLVADGGKAVQVDYDAVSGYVRYHGLRLSEKQFVRERFQSDEFFIKKDIPVPRMVTEIHYDLKQPTTRRITIYVLSAVDIGNEIDRAEFNLSIPIGTNVVLFDGPPGKNPPGVRPSMGFTKTAVDDAAEFARSAEFLRMQRK